MVAQKFGKNDPDLKSRVGRSSRKGTKEISDKPMRGPGTDVKVSAMIGGISNIGGVNRTRKMTSGKKTP